MGGKTFNYRFPLIKLKAKQVLKRQMLGIGDFPVPIPPRTEP
jgi:hypothetical protein